MSYAASRGNIIILIIALGFALRMCGGIFSPLPYIIKKSNSTQHVAKSEREKSSYQIPQATKKKVKLKDLYSAAERGDKKAQVAFFMFIGGLIVCLLGSLFFIFEAFGLSALWGICVLFFNGIAIVIFSIFHWNRAKIPLLVYLMGVFMLVVGNVLAK
jgi:hypothetical protein